jgi:HlyD family secretion protein
VASQTFEKKEIVLGVSDGIFVEVKEGLQITDKLKVWNALKAVSASE